MLQQESELAALEGPSKGAGPTQTPPTQTPPTPAASTIDWLVANRVIAAKLALASVLLFFCVEWQAGGMTRIDNLEGASNCIIIIITPYSLSPPVDRLVDL